MSTTIAFIGAGNMASALIRGLIQSGHPANHIIATDSHPETLATAGELGIQTLADNADAVALADLVVLAVKPQGARAVLEP